jgi:hypothetical protein
MNFLLKKHVTRCSASVNKYWWSMLSWDVANSVGICPRTFRKSLSLPSLTFLKIGPLVPSKTFVFDYQPKRRNISEKRRHHYTAEEI